MTSFGGSRSDAERPSSPAPVRVIAGGIVAHNDERRIERSVRSLLAQRLPNGTEWGRIWVVASGCTDATVEIARAVAAEEPRIGIVVEPERRGKASAIREVLRRAEGESLVLLNSDAFAAPGSVDALLATAAGKRRPFAVMARPTMGSTVGNGWAGSLRWMWDLHHELHLQMLRDGRGAHLSDELLLVSLPAVPWIEDGVINDGSYCAVWLQQHAGGCWYAPEAQVAVEIPPTPAEHLRQRRRIHVGNMQVAERLGRPPSTIFRYLFEQPSRTIRSVRRTLARDRGLRSLACIGVLEAAARMLALWDRLPPRRDHVLWQRIRSSDGTPRSRVDPASPPPAPEDLVERRIRMLERVAREFHTAVPWDRTVELLPTAAPGPCAGVVDRPLPHPGVPTPHRTIESGPAPGGPERAARGQRYFRAAEALFEGPLRRLVPWVESVGVTGSTAYGEPESGDDLDFYVITRPGALPIVLAGTYLALRLEEARRGIRLDPRPCFNYVIDGRRAGEELAAGRGLLFQREALTARMFRGEGFYRGLLAQTPQLGTDFPRLYAARTDGARAIPPRPAPWSLRVASAFTFLPLAAYLQLVGLRRNARVRRAGDRDAHFRTITTPRRVAFQSARFERIKRLYDEPGPERTAAPPPASASAAR